MVAAAPASVVSRPRNHTSVNSLNFNGGNSMSVTDSLVRNNESYVRSFAKGNLSLPPAKHVAVLACMDARLDVHKILGLEEGDALVGYERARLNARDRLLDIAFEVAERLQGEGWTNPDL